MKIKTVVYERLFNLGNFSNEKIGVSIDIEEGDSYDVVLDNARKLVESQSLTVKVKEQKRQDVKESVIKKAMEVTESPKGYIYEDVQKAMDILAYVKEHHDIPEEYYNKSNNIFRKPYEDDEMPF